jgi:hypothetical protein
LTNPEDSTLLASFIIELCLSVMCSDCAKLQANKHCGQLGRELAVSEPWGSKQAVASCASSWIVRIAGSTRGSYDCIFKTNNIAATESQYFKHELGVMKQM